MKKWLPTIVAFLALLLQFIGYRTLRNFPTFIERYYSTGIYPYIERAMRFGLGWIPFSFGDLVYTLLIALAIRWLFLFVISVFKRSSKRQLSIYRLLLTINVALLYFHLVWGFNYYRQPLNEILKLDATYTDAELELVSQQLVFTANKLHQQLQPVDSIAVVFDEPQSALFERAPQAFENLKSIDPALSIGPSSVKKSLLTIPLTYMGYSGYLNPLTGEAQTNGNINNYKTPVLILHEMSHQLGFAKENEANFIAILAGLRHEDLYFQYSATIFGLRYCLNDLYRKDPAAFENIRNQMRYGIFKNYQELEDFWAPYDDNIIEQASQATYNKYLEANNQPDGMRTYSYVVALLVNYYK